MKKLILALLIYLPFYCYSQPGRIWEEATKPTTPKTNFLKDRDFILVQDSTFMWINNSWSYVPVAPEGRQGEKGDKGDPGTSTAVFPFTFPTQFGATGDGRTIAQAGMNISQFPGTGATINNTVDWASMQMCVNAGKTIFMNTNLKIDREIIVAKNNHTLTIIGGNFIIYTTNNNAFSMLYRPTPSSLSDAEIMTTARYHISGLHLSGGNNQVGYDLGSGYQHHFEDILTAGLKTGIHLKFSLQTHIQNCMGNACLNGVIADWYQGQAWATTTNSQSNRCDVQNYRFYSTISNAVGLTFYSSDGSSVRNYICEGFVVGTACKVDGMGATTNWTFTADGYHYECVNPSTDCSFRINMPAGNITLSNLVSHYPTILCDATSSSGMLYVKVENVGWWVSVSGKAFRNNNCGWNINYCNAFYNPAKPSDTLLTFFSGTPVKWCASLGCGYNSVSAIFPNR